MYRDLRGRQIDTRESKHLCLCTQGGEKSKGRGFNGRVASQLGKEEDYTREKNEDLSRSLEKKEASGEVVVVAFMHARRRSEGGDG